MDSGIGLLAAAAAVRRLRPDADLVLSSDPDGMPWGPRTPAGRDRARARRGPRGRGPPARRTDRRLQHRLRARPAHAPRRAGTRRCRSSAPSPRSSRPRPAAAPSRSGPPPPPPAARTSADSSVTSPRSVAVTEVPCPGLADAVQHADEAAIDRAVAAAAALTPPDVRAVVLGCTHYELVAERIRAAVQQPGLPPGHAARLRRGRRRPGAAPDRRRTRSFGRTGHRAHRAAQRPRRRAAGRRPGLRRGPAAGRAGQPRPLSRRGGPVDGPSDPSPAARNLSTLLA